MEQANNTWNKGLQMDTHPMMQGNDSMTDCLNGTLISMNGNEVILQNDMGNRRIDHAFLPSGYEPVGIKEHGGIIYVASYNPITNKSQIGSFPSPERIIDINDDNLKNSFDFDSFFKEKTSEGGNIQNDSTLNIPVMISDSFLISLTPKNKLHVGDIFTVYSPHLSKLAPDLTNYDNIEHSIDKVYSPKNRKYTLQLGILNEQNNFNDITSSLVRWDSPLKEVTEKEYNEYKTTKEIRYYIYENNVQKEVTEEYYNSFIGTKQLKYFIYVPQIIRNLENKSQLYKFNTGYFIPDGFLFDKDIDGKTIDDTNLIKSRKQIAANNFSYKLAGPLYLKASYNHVHNFGYTINGTWDGTDAKLKITGYFTYNCPDGVNTINDNGDSDYYTFETGKPTNIQFDFFDNNKNTLNKPAKIEPSATSTSTCIYNKTTNLYTVTQIKDYTIENPGDIYNYVIGVQGGKYNGNNIFYIKDLSSIGQINLRLLNSGAITLKQYKFYNKAETHDTTMTLEFETYPKEGQTFEDMYLKFENIDNDKHEPARYLFLKQPILNGKQIFSFNWLDSISDENGEYGDNINLASRQTYKVTIHYNDSDNTLIQEINTDLDQKREQLSQKTDPAIVEQLQEQINILQDQLEDLDSYDDGVDRWLLTTELFNDLYSSNITDYCTTQDARITNRHILFKPSNINYSVFYGQPIFDSNLPLYSNNNDTVSANSILVKCPVTINASVESFKDIIQQLPFDVTINESSYIWNTIIEKDIPIYNQRRQLLTYNNADTIENIINTSTCLLLVHGLAQDVSAGGTDPKDMWSSKYSDSDITQVNSFYSENIRLSEKEIYGRDDASLIGYQHHNSQFNIDTRFIDIDDDSSSKEETLSNVFLKDSSFISTLSLIPTLLVASIRSSSKYIKYLDYNADLEDSHYSVSKLLLIDSKKSICLIYDDVKNALIYNFIDTNPQSAYILNFKLTQVDWNIQYYNDNVQLNVIAEKSPYRFGNLGIIVDNIQSIPISIPINENDILNYLTKLQFKSSIKYYDRQNQTPIENNGEFENIFGIISPQNISYKEISQETVMWVDGDASARYTLLATVAKTQ